MNSSNDKPGDRWSAPDYSKKMSPNPANRFQRIYELLVTLRIETRAVAGHDDPGSIEDCWREAFDELIQIEEAAEAPRPPQKDREQLARLRVMAAQDGSVAIGAALRHIDAATHQQGEGA